jgi:Tfp pilus assembly protein PilF
VNTSGILTYTRFIVGSFLIAGMFLSIGGCADVVTYAKDSRREGVKYYNAGAYTDAAGAFRNAIRQEPRDYKSHYYLGASYEQLHQYQQAIQAYKSSLDVMDTTLAGKNDPDFRSRVMDGLASAISKSDERDVEMNKIETAARTNATGENYLLLAKVYRYSGDADLAVDAYNRAMLLDPNDINIAKEYGLYLEQLGQPTRAEVPLRRAYAIDPTDTQVAAALRRIGVVPGPAIKSEDQLAKPALPNGPIPDVDWSSVGLGRTEQGTNQTEETIVVPPSPTAQTPRD